MSAVGDERLRGEALSAHAQDESAVARDATYVAIWGEPPPTERRARSTPGFPDTAPFDPWGESADLSSATAAPDPL
jgi:hypothetical protein